MLSPGQEATACAGATCTGCSIHRCGPVCPFQPTSVLRRCFRPRKPGSLRPVSRGACSWPSMHVGPAVPEHRHPADAGAPSSTCLLAVATSSSWHGSHAIPPQDACRCLQGACTTNMPTPLGGMCSEPIPNPSHAAQAFISRHAAAHLCRLPSSWLEASVLFVQLTSACKQ